MAKVANLKLQIQSGTTSTLVASWSMDISKTTITNYKIKVGNKVSIKSGATYYNGVDVPDWVEAKQWIVSEVSGNRIVINKSVDGKNAINSPIHAQYLSIVGTVNDAPVQKNTIDHYVVTWKYDTGDGIWFSGESSDTTDQNALYTIPSNAIKVKVSVKPVSKTYKVGDKDKSYWSGTAATATHVVSSSPPETASAPTVTIEGYKLTAVLENIEDPRADRIYFEIVRDNQHGSSKCKTGYCDVQYQRAAYSCTVDAGFSYRVRCRAANGVKNTLVYGEWSPYSSSVSTSPKPISKLKCYFASDSSAHLTWQAGSAATSYEIQYTTNQNYFDKSTEVSSTTSEGTEIYITGLDTGNTWYFRVRSVNEQGNSAWSNPVSAILGTTPSAPTTWSSTVTGMIGDKVTLYWVHNSEDGSKQTAALVRLTVINETTTIPLSYENTGLIDEEDNPIYSYVLDLSDYSDGTEISWQVQTKGIASSYSPRSTARTITVYAPPTLELHLGEESAKWLWDTFNFETDTTETAATGEYLECYPYDIKAIAGPDTGNTKAQVPLCYRVSVTAEDTYETEDIFGRIKVVQAGTEVFSKTIYTSEYTLETALEAGEVELENDQAYKVTVTVIMNSGLTASESGVFIVNWYEHLYEPDAGIAIDKDSLSAYISPFCLDDYGALDDDVTLSVYRREYDGSFTEIATDLVNDGVITVTDPHPSLDYARYRIIARNKNTSVSGYSDIPGMPINEPAIVIQWDDSWTTFDYTEEAEPIIPPWSGSLVKLPYNVDVSESHAPDVSLIKYIGRKNPVSYYGTQRGETANWSTVIPKSDKETIYALRRLSAWMGDVYVREPNGVGYWAQITVSMNINHLELTVPVSFTITRVEGGM